MAHKIIENSKEAFVIFEGVLNSEDAKDYHILEIFDKDIKKTIDFTNITCYNECVVGFMEICNQLGIPYKERKKR